MNIAILLLVSVIVLGIAVSFLVFPYRRFPRVLAALVLVGIVLFCGFGFLASYEYSDPSKRLPWQIGYGVLGLACLSGAVLLLRRRRQNSKSSTTDRPC